MKKIYFTVTNDLTYDQRMHRICNSLSKNGYAVFLIGRELKSSIPLKQKNFQQKRIKCFFTKSILFYVEYNLKLFFFLLFKKMDGVCAIDLDTILPCLLLSKIKKTKRIYDAHEYFTEMKELLTRPAVKKAWLLVEKFCVPKYKYGYTVSEGLADQFRKNYGRNYEVIRNLPVLKKLQSVVRKEKTVFYQGAVNEARGFEYLIPAMKDITGTLVICGDGNFMPQVKKLITRHRVEHKVILKGMVDTEELWELSQGALFGINLVENNGINQYYSLANKFFDYIHAALPQLTMDFPEYRKVNDEYKVAILINRLQSKELAEVINSTMENMLLLEELRKNALNAREVFCWQNEEKKLIRFYHQIFNN